MNAGAVLVVGLSIASTFAAGLACELAGLRRALANRVTWIALAGNLVVVPLIAWFALPPVVSGPAATGLVLVAAAPGGGIGPLLALLGKGDASLAAALFLVLSLAGTVVAFVVAVVLDTGLGEMARAAGLVAATALAPLVAGIVVNRRAPRVATAMRPWTSRLGALLLVATVAWFSVQRGRNVSASVLAGAAIVAVASILVGWVAARTADRAVAIAVIEISLVRNVALTLVVVTGLGGAPDAIISVLTYALVMLVTGGLLAIASSRRIRIAAASRSPWTARRRRSGTSRPTCRR